MSKHMPQREVRCYHCGNGLRVGERALTTMCPHCYRGLRVDDVILRGRESFAAVQTCGMVLVHRKARVLANVVQASMGVQVEGGLRADVISGGPVLIGPRAFWKGGCRAPSLDIRDGASVLGGLFEITPDVRFGDPSIVDKPAKRTESHLNPSPIEAPQPVKDLREYIRTLPIRQVERKEERPGARAG